MKMNNYSIVNIVKDSEVGCRGELQYNGKFLADILFNKTSAALVYASTEDVDYHTSYLTYHRLYDLISLGIAYHYYLNERKPILSIFLNDSRMVLTESPIDRNLDEICKLVLDSLIQMEHDPTVQVIACRFLDREEDFNISGEFNPVRYQGNRLSVRIAPNIVVYPPYVETEKPAP